MAEKSLYSTHVMNHDGLTGTTYVEGNEGLTLGVSSSLMDAPGTNPEQFIGFAVSTCFNGTIRLVEERKKLPQESTIRTTVDIVKDAVGYKFVVHTQIKFDTLDKSTASGVVDAALDECPVAKLIKANADVFFEIVDDFDSDPTLGE